MVRSLGSTGFDSPRIPVASSRLAHAVVVSLALGSLSLFLIVTLTAMSIKTTMAMPLPA